MAEGLAEFLPLEEIYKCLSEDEYLNLKPDSFGHFPVSQLKCSPAGSGGWWRRNTSGGRARTRSSTASSSATRSAATQADGLRRRARQPARHRAPTALWRRREWTASWSRSPASSPSFSRRSSSSLTTNVSAPTLGRCTQRRTSTSRATWKRWGRGVGDDRAGNCGSPETAHEAAGRAASSEPAPDQTSRSCSPGWTPCGGRSWRPSQTRTVGGLAGGPLVFCCLGGVVVHGWPLLRYTQLSDRFMDTWKFYDITHRGHVVCNPTRRSRTLGKPGAASRQPRVVDIACGKGEFLIRLAEAYGVRGVGRGPLALHRRGGTKAQSARATGRNHLHPKWMGADFSKPDKPHSLTRFVHWGELGFSAGTRRRTRCGRHGRARRLGDRGAASVAGAVGRALAGVWANKRCLRKPRKNVEAGQRRGLDLVHTLVSSKDDWDRYEGLQWHAMAEYARAERDDADLPELLERVAKEKTVYLRWGRDALGWAIYVFRCPSARGTEAVPGA